jgi:hypothetical protein
MPGHPGKSCMVEFKICGSSLWTLLHVTLRILKWLLDLLKIWETLIYVNKTTEEQATTYPALVLHPSYIPEKVGIN